MADSNIFGGAQSTPVDTDELAMGTGGSFFNITWAAFKALIHDSFTSLKIGGVEVIDSSRNIIASSAIFKSTVSGDSNTVSITDGNRGVKITSPSSVGDGEITVINTNKDINVNVRDFDGLNIDGITGLTSISNSLDVTGTGDFTGIVTAAGFVPFTGCHIAKSSENLQLGELVQIKSVGWVNPKQPDWIAEYCNGSKKGVYGVVYDIQMIDIMEDYEEIVITKRLLLPDKSEIVVKQRKISEYTQYLIAAVGDGFITVDCACEYGDVLIPSETKGLATVYKGDYIPLNSVGFAGQDSESGKISWTKE